MSGHHHPAAQQLRVAGCSWCVAVVHTRGKWLQVSKPCSVLHTWLNTAAGVLQGSSARGYYHADSSPFLSPSPRSQEHCDKKGSINTSGVWYSTVSHNDKPESCAANTKTQTEYAIVNVPRSKQCTIYSEDQNAYDYVLIH